VTDLALHGSACGALGPKDLSGVSRESDVAAGDEESLRLISRIHGSACALRRGVAACSVRRSPPMAPQKDCTSIGKLARLSRGGGAGARIRFPTAGDGRGGRRPFARWSSRSAGSPRLQV
jgi:hypothetical protein